MTVYKVKTGHDQALIDLVAVTPQPNSVGIRETRRGYSASGSVKQQGLYVELVFTTLQNATMYQSVLNQFGVQSALTSAVTVYIRSDTFAWVRMNGTAVRPEIGQDATWQDFYPQNIVILIKGLEAAA